MICARGIVCLLDISGPGKMEPAAVVPAGILGHGKHAVKDAPVAPAVSRLQVSVESDGATGFVQVSACPRKLEIDCRVARLLPIPDWPR